VALSDREAWGNYGKARKQKSFSKVLLRSTRSGYKWVPVTAERDSPRKSKHRENKRASGRVLSHTPRKATNICGSNQNRPTLLAGRHGQCQRAHLKEKLDSTGRRKGIAKGSRRGGRRVKQWKWRPKSSVNKESKMGIWGRNKAINVQGGRARLLLGGEKRKGTGIPIAN